MWTRTDIAGQPADVFSPDATARPSFGLLFLHDLDGATLAGNPVFTRLLEKHQLACVCPHGKQTWWTDRVCPEFDPVQTAEKYLIQAIFPFCLEHWRLAPRRFAPFGVGMGGQGALRLAFKHVPVFPVVAGLGAALDCHEWYGRGSPLDEMYDSKEQCRQDCALLHLPPVHYPPHIFFAIDPDDRLWYRGNDRLHEKMTALGVPHTIDFATRAGGHTWDYYQHMGERVVDFLVAGLVQESRRLL